MAGASVVVTFDDAAITAALGRMVRLAQDTRPLMRAIGVGLVENTISRIEAETSPDGTPFAPLNPAYALIKRGPGILREAGQRGGLLGSLTSSATPLSVTVGSNKVYAAIHQFGGVIRPVNAPALIFRLGAPSAPGPSSSRRGGGKRKPGTRLVFAQSVTIPARPYLGFSDADHATVLEAVEVIFGRLLHG